MKKQERKKTGTSRMLELGKQPIQLWVTGEELAAIREAATRDRRPVTQWVLLQALQALQVRRLRERR